MAKEKTAPLSRTVEIEPSGAASAPEVAVSATTTDAEVIVLTETKELTFNFEDFRELDGRVLDKLSRRSLDRYVVELGLYRRRVEREATDKEFGSSGLRIEVMGDNALGRTAVDGLPESFHHYWEKPENVYARKKMGYLTVDGRFPEVVAGDSNSKDGTHEIKRGDGSTELVLMACPQDHYERRLQGQADRSHTATGSGAGQFEEKARQAVPGMQTSFQAKPIEKITVGKDA